MKNTVKAIKEILDEVVGLLINDETASLKVAERDPYITLGS